MHLRSKPLFVLSLLLLFLAIAAIECSAQHAAAPACTKRTNPVPAIAPRGHAPKRVYEVHYCVGLDITYIHIFKNAGTTVLRKLRHFCNATTGAPTLMFANWDPNGRQLTEASLRQLCVTSKCFTFWREPVGRLLSGYHEVMRIHHTRRAPSRLPSQVSHFVLPSNASRSKVVANFERFLSAVERGAVRNANVNDQRSFVMTNGQPVFPNLAAFPLTELSSQLPEVFCDAFARCAPGELCPVALASVDGTRNRDRSSSDYGLQQYVLDESELPTQLIVRIVNHFRSDYCLFDIPLHERGPRQISCS